MSARRARPGRGAVSRADLLLALAEGREEGLQALARTLGLEDEAGVNRARTSSTGASTSALGLSFVVAPDAQDRDDLRPPVLLRVARFFPAEEVVAPDEAPLTETDETGVLLDEAAGPPPSRPPEPGPLPLLASPRAVRARLEPFLRPRRELRRVDVRRLVRRMARLDPVERLPRLVARRSPSRLRVWVDARIESYPWYFDAVRTLQLLRRDLGSTRVDVRVHPYDLDAPERREPKARSIDLRLGRIPARTLPNARRVTIAPAGATGSGPGPVLRWPGTAPARGVAEEARAEAVRRLHAAVVVAPVASERLLRRVRVRLSALDRSPATADGRAYDFLTEREVWALLNASDPGPEYRKPLDDSAPDDPWTVSAVNATAVDFRLVPEGVLEAWRAFDAAVQDAVFETLWAEMRASARELEAELVVRFAVWSMSAERPHWPRGTDRDARPLVDPAARAWAVRTILESARPIEEGRPDDATLPWRQMVERLGREVVSLAATGGGTGGDPAMARFVSKMRRCFEVLREYGSLRSPASRAALERPPGSGGAPPERSLERPPTVRFMEVVVVDDGDGAGARTEFRRRAVAPGEVPTGADARGRFRLGLLSFVGPTADLVRRGGLESERVDLAESAPVLGGRPPHALHEVRTDLGTWTLEHVHPNADEYGDWASMGQDVYGLWADFEVAGVRQRMRWIPPGRFVMGSPADEEGRDDYERQHEVILTRGFWLGATTVTNAFFRAVTGEARNDAPGLPAVEVSAQDADAFCTRLGAGFTLPTEAEWEWACRAGTDTPYWFGREIDRDQVRHALRPDAGPVPAGSLPPNGFGLHEMHGNVREWCADAFSPEYPRDPVDPYVDPRTVPGDRSRVQRGGSFAYVARSCRSACRRWDRPERSWRGGGVRLARGSGASRSRLPAEPGGRAPPGPSAGAGGPAAEGGGAARPGGASNRRRT